MTARNAAMTKNALRASASTDSASPPARSHLPRDPLCRPAGVTRPDAPLPVAPLPPDDTMLAS